ncbi:conserved hypothetical protein, partial [Streptomyces sviceus ATCC 29083]
MRLHHSGIDTWRMCDARPVTSESTGPAHAGTAPDMATLAKVVARQRAEMDRLRDQTATSAVMERAKGAIMALTGCTPDAAGEELLQRAKTGSRTLLEECWITLGSLPPLGTTTEPRVGDDAPGANLSAIPAPTGPRSVRPDTAGPADQDTCDLDDGSTALGRLGKALVHVVTPRDLAGCLLEELRTDVDADALLLFRSLQAGGLELIGHAGIDATLAAQWARVPPLSGIAALEALRAREPRWLEDFTTDRDRHLLIGNPPERWLSRAWLPVPTGDDAEVCIGILRARSGPFSSQDRQLLQAVVRLCAGWLRSFGARSEHSTAAAAAAAQPVFDSLPGSAVLLTPLRGPSGEVEDYRIDAATEQAVDVVGRTGRQLLGRRILECFPSLADGPVWHGCLRALTTGEPFESEPFAYQEVVDGAAALATYTLHAARLGGALVVTWVRHDSSDRQEQRLADVQRLGNLGWANWNLVTGEGSWSSQTFLVMHRDPVLGPVRLAGLPGLALPEDAPVLAQAVRELVRSGRQFDVPFRIRAGDEVRHLRMVAEVVTD